MHERVVGGQDEEGAERGGVLRHWALAFFVEIRIAELIDGGERDAAELVEPFDVSRLGEIAAGRIDLAGAFVA